MSEPYAVLIGAKPILNAPDIVRGIGESVAAAVPQHMSAKREGEDDASDRP